MRYSLKYKPDAVGCTQMSVELPVGGFKFMNKLAGTVAGFDLDLPADQIAALVAHYDSYGMVMAPVAAPPAPAKGGKE